MRDDPFECVRIDSRLKVGKQKNLILSVLNANILRYAFS